MMWWWGDGHMGAAGWVGMGFMILFWVAVVVGIVYLVRYLMSRPSPGGWHERPPQWPGPGGPAQFPGPRTGQPGQGAPGAAQGKSDALRILEERYARGEIDREEFQRRKADLTS